MQATEARAIIFFRHLQGRFARATLIWGKANLEDVIKMKPKVQKTLREKGWVIEEGKIIQKPY